jgi:hypothetical protein
MNDRVALVSAEPFTVMGIVVALVGFLPGAVVLVQWLSRKEGDPPLAASPLSLIPAALIILWGAWMATSREDLTVDAGARTLAWQRTALGISLGLTTWSFDDLKGLEEQGITRSGNTKTLLVTSKSGEVKTVIDAYRTRPDELRKALRLLPVTLAE